VGATDRNDNLASFSNYNFNDISAPGVGILSTLRSDELYEVYSGTSMATPHVAGAVAMLRAVNPSLSPTEIQALLRNSATPTGDLRLGAGVLNVARAFNALVPGSTAGGNAVQLSLSAGGAASEGELAARGEIETDAPFLPGQVLVTFDRADRAELVTQTLLGDRARVTHRPASATSYALVQLEIDGLDTAAARQRTLDAIAIFLASDEVVYAEPNYILQVR
ncbi:MAG: S8 family serine peptidase, partial [Cyanobacteria bacterium J06648_11]